MRLEAFKAFITLVTAFLDLQPTCTASAVRPTQPSLCRYDDSTSFPLRSRRCFFMGLEHHKLLLVQTFPSPPPPSPSSRSICSAVAHLCCSRSTSPAASSSSCPGSRSSCLPRSCQVGGLSSSQSCSAHFHLSFPLLMTGLR